jgi:hypothetical protein
MRRWSKLLIEIYHADHYEGRWEVENDEIGLDLNYLRSCVKSIRADVRYAGAKFQFLEDGDECVFGVFCGREPPVAPNRGTILPSELFDPTE